MHRLSVVVAAAAMVWSLWCLPALQSAIDAGNERTALRAPVAAQDVSRATAIVDGSIDTAWRRQVPVVMLVPLSADAVPPPGLGRWPEPGEAFLSPALAGDDPTAAIRTRYGRFGGLIDKAGLHNSGELLAYYRPLAKRAELIAGTDTARFVSGFGGEAGSYVIPVSSMTTRDLQQLLAVIILAATALLVVAARTGSRRRDERLALLEALGGNRRSRATVLLGEVAGPVLRGIALGVGCVWTLTLVGLRLPFSGYQVPGADLAGARGAIPIVVMVAGLMVATVAVLAPLRSPARSGGRPRVLRERTRRWPTAAFVIAMISVAVGAAVRGNTGRTLFGTGMLAGLAILPIAATWIVAAAGRGIGDWGWRTGNLGLLIGGRWLAARPGVIARTGAALVIGLGLMTQAQVMQSQLTAAGATASTLRHRVGDHLIQVSSPGRPELARYAASLPAHGHLRIYRTPQPERYSPENPPVEVTVVGTASALGRLGEVRRLTPGRSTADATFQALGRTWDQLTHTDVLGAERGLAASQTGVATQPPPGTRLVEVVIFNDSGPQGVEVIKRSAFASIPLPYVRVVADEWEAAAAGYASLVNWLLDLFIPVLLLLLACGAVAAAGVFVSQSRELGALSAFSSRLSLYQGVGLANLGVSLALVTVLGASTAAGIGLAMLRLAPYAHLSWTFLGTATAVGILLAALVGLICGQVAWQAARGWRPTGD